VRADRKTNPQEIEMAAKMTKGKMPKFGKKMPMPAPKSAPPMTAPPAKMVAAVKFKK
jgi:hypothetical protein